MQKARIAPESYSNNADGFQDANDNIDPEEMPLLTGRSSNYLLNETLSVFSKISNVKHLSEMLLLRLFRTRESFEAGNEKVFSEIILEEQTESHERDTKNLFYWVKHGDLNTLKEKIRETLANDNINELELINKRDSIGGHIIHLAYLLENYKIGHWLVETYPQIALKAHDGVLSAETLKMKPELANIQNCESLMPNTGENILHMVIVRRNYEEVRWLLDFYKDHEHSVPRGLVRLLTSNATGKFFDQKGNFYYGGYPLQFAVCSNNTDIFDLVLSYTASLSNDDDGEDDDDDDDEDDAATSALLKDLQSLGSNVIFMRDAFGNNVLHLCVIHCLKDMYKHVFKTAGNIIKKEIKLLYAKEMCAANAGPGPFLLKDLNILEKHKEKQNVCLGYNFKPKSLYRPKPEMVDDWVDHETKIKVEERLVMALNNDLNSPLTLAAARMHGDDLPPVAARKVEMFNFLLQMHRTLLDDYGILSFAEIDLTGLEIEYDFADYDIPPEDVSVRYKIRSAIDWMCLNNAKQAIVIPDVRRIIETKWKRCGMQLFIFELIVNIIIVLSITLISVFVNVKPSLTPDSSVVAFTSILYLLVWVIFLFGFLLELKAIICKPREYLRIKGVPKFHIFCKILKMAAFVLYCIFRIGHDIDYRNDLAVKLNLAVCLLTSWIHMYYYLMAFEKTGPFMLTLARIIGDEIPNFLKFFIIIIIAFACGLALLVDDGSCGELYGLSLIFKVIWVLIQNTLHPPISASLTVANISNVADNLQWMADMLTVFYFGIVNIVLLNILIAVINAVYAYYTSYNEETKTLNNEPALIIAKYNILDYMDCFFSEKTLSARRKLYCNVRPTDRNSSRFDDDESYNEVRVQNIKNDYFFQVKEKLDFWTIEDASDGREAKNIIMLIVDPQIDFHSNGTLPIAAADADSDRIAAFIRTHKSRIHNIVVTLESRYQYHISHSLFWKDANGFHPKDYTVITNRDIANKTWIPVDSKPEVYDWCLSYTKNVEQKGLRKLTIWPEHCIVGSRGQAIVPVINQALQEWASNSDRPVTYVTKGENWKTETYSALEAEFVDPLDFSTSLNTELLASLQMADQVILFVNLWRNILLTKFECSFCSYWYADRRSLMRSTILFAT